VHANVFITAFWMQQYCDLYQNSGPIFRHWGTNWILPYVPQVFLMRTYRVLDASPVMTGKTDQSSNSWERGESLCLCWLCLTRKLSYCKDDCTVRPICGCPENFREFLSTPTAVFAEIFNGLLFRSILWMCVQNLNFVALAIPEIIGGTQ